MGLSTGDASIVRSAAAGFKRILRSSREDGEPFVDVLFSNLAEANALLEVLAGDGGSAKVSAGAAAVALSRFARVAFVTDGENGSDVGVAGNATCPAVHVHVDAEATKLVETCGAGDAYAAGVMYAWHVLESRGSMGLEAWGTVANFASKLAAVVVG